MYTCTGRMGFVVGQSVDDLRGTCCHSWPIVRNGSGRMVMASGVEFVESPNEGVLFREVSVQSSAVARVGHGDVCLSPASSLKTR